MHLYLAKVSFRSSKYTYVDIQKFLFGDAFRLTFDFGKIYTNPKSRHDYLVGMHLTICIWTLQKSIEAHQNIHN